MKNEFNVIYKYAVAIKGHDKDLKLVTRRRRFSEKANTDNYEYQISTTNQIDEGVCTTDTLGDLMLLMDAISDTQLFGSAGENVALGYTLIPVMLSVATVDCTDDIDKANLSLRRVKALAKLTTEDKLVLGIKE